MNIKKLENLSYLVNNKKVLRLIIDNDESKIDLFLKNISDLKKESESNINLIDRYFDVKLKRTNLFPGICALSNRTLDQLKELVDKGISTNLDRTRLLFDTSILENRKEEEQLKLIDKYIELNKNLKVYEIITNKDILKFRNNNSQLSLISAFVKSSYNDNVYDLIINSNLIKTRSIVDQLLLIDSYIKSNYNNYVYKLITNNCVIKYRLGYEQIKLIDKYIKLIGVLNDHDLETIYTYMCYSDILEKRSYLEQLKLIDLYINLGIKMENKVSIHNIILDVSVSFNEQMSRLDKSVDYRVCDGIDCVDDLKELVNMLKESGIKEFNSNTKILIKGNNT